VAIRFYMDVHVPAGITGALRRRGIDVLTSQEDGTREVADDALLERAGELDRVLVSQDTDLL
jgi:predicted nuclease of predicted toxin-antitoxin system